MKLVSVIVPVYHTSGMVLHRCVNSILEQTYSNLELLIVDDGNPDSYQHHFEELENSDSRIKVLHQNNKGASAARNTGIENASGEYISFVDSDDYLDCSFFTKMVRAAENNDIAICGVEDQCYTTRNQWCDRRLFFSKPSIFSGVQYVNFPVNKLYRTDLIREANIRFPQEVKLGEDAIFLADYYKHCSSFQIIPDRLYHYIYSSNSAVHTYQEQYWEWEKKVIQEQWEMFHQYPLSENEEQAMRAWLYSKYTGAVRYYEDNEPDNVKAKHMLECITEFPLFCELQKCDLTLSNKYLNFREKTAIFIVNKMGKHGMKPHGHLRKR